MFCTPGGHTWESHIQGHTGVSQSGKHMFVYLEATHLGWSRPGLHGVTQQETHALYTRRSHLGGHVQGHTGISQSGKHIFCTPGGHIWVVTSRITPGSQQTTVGLQINT